MVIHKGDAAIPHLTLLRAAQIKRQRLQYKERVMGSNNNETASRCPVIHGSRTKLGDKSRSNRDWWPNQLNLKIPAPERH